jgi:hypothetical protein
MALMRGAAMGAAGGAVAGGMVEGVGFARGHGKALLAVAGLERVGISEADLDLLSLSQGKKLAAIEKSIQNGALGRAKTEFYSLAAGMDDELAQRMERKLFDEERMRSVRKSVGGTEGPDEVHGEFLDDLHGNRSGDQVFERKLQPHPNVNSEIGINDFKYSQSSAGKFTRDGDSIEKIVDAMRKHGWDISKEPPRMIKMSDGSIVTLDHRRMIAARMAGIKKVPIELIDGGTPIAESYALRREFYLKIKGPRYRFDEIANLLQVPEESIGKKYIAKNWEEAVIIRCANQTKTFPLFGSTEIPKLK